MSMIQQINYMVNWRTIIAAAHEDAMMRSINPSYAFIATHNLFDNIVFLIRFYCYNVQSLLFLFWAIGLWRATWKSRPDLLRVKDENIVLIAKFFAILFPIPIVGTMRIELIIKDPILKLIWSNLVLMVSTTAGCVFLVLILYNYVHVHRKVAACKYTGPTSKVEISFRVNRGERDSGIPTKPSPPCNMRSISYDRWLIARFLVCFFLSHVLQVCLIIYYMVSYDRIRVLSVQDGPDYGLRHTLYDIAISMPGVTSGLLIFIVFGTTAPFRREYRMWFQPCKRKRQGRDGPIMVAPLDSFNAANKETLSARRRSFDEEETRISSESGRRSSVSSTWELPPMDFDEFSEKEVLPRSLTET